MCRLVFVVAVAISLVTFSYLKMPEAQSSELGTAYKRLTNESAPVSADERVANYTEWLAILTGFLVVVTSGQIFFLIRADGTARLAAEAAKRAAVATENSVKTMDQTAKTQLRPYVVISKVVRDGEHELPLQFIITIKNSGQTPAYNFVVHDGWVMATTEPRKGIIPIGSPEYQLTLGPKDKTEHLLFIMADETHEFGVNDLQSIIDGKTAVYMEGFISYSDAFERVWYTNFKFIYDKNGAEVAGIAYCKEGNESI